MLLKLSFDLNHLEKIVFFKNKKKKVYMLQVFNSSICPESIMLGLKKDLARIYFTWHIIM